MGGDPPRCVDPAASEGSPVLTSHDSLDYTNEVIAAWDSVDHIAGKKVK